ncbi:hypothetical protein IT575_13895 [bacterium]|nr:hypothetical protein [bacterium]
MDKLLPRPLKPDPASNYTPQGLFTASHTVPRPRKPGPPAAFFAHAKAKALQGPYPQTVDKRMQLGLSVDSTLINTVSAEMKQDLYNEFTNGDKHPGDASYPQRPLRLARERGKIMSSDSFIYLVGCWFLGLCSIIAAMLQRQSQQR